MKAAQPALLFIVPITLGPVSLLALLRGEFKEFWSGNMSDPPPAEEVDQSVEPKSHNEDPIMFLIMFINFFTKHLAFNFIIFL